MEKEILYRFFRGETGPDEERRLMEWLDADEENRRMFDRERAVFDALLLFAPVPGAAQRSPGMRLRRMAGRRGTHRGRRRPGGRRRLGVRRPPANAAGSS